MPTTPIELSLPPEGVAPPDAADVVDLAVLGALTEGPMTADQVAKVVRRIVGSKFSPTLDVVLNRVAALETAGDITPAGAPPFSEAPRFRLSDAGLDRLRLLLRDPQPFPRDPVGEAALGLTVALLDVLPDEERGPTVAVLVQVHEEELSRLRAAVAACPSRSPFVKRWLGHQVMRLESEIAWLNSMDGQD